MSTSLQTTTAPRGASSSHTTIRAHKQLLSANAAFYRGGTSKGVIFEASELPKSDQDREHLFRSCIGSPDPYGRQLDGMGGGISSVSKVCVVKRSEHHEADVDFTFVQVSSHYDDTRSWGLILRSYSTSGRRQRWDPGYRLKLWKYGVRNRTFCTGQANAKHDR
jgi:hypothetical protein